VRILITRTDRIGDVILSLPVIENLRRVWPQSFLAMVVRPYTAPLLKNNPFLDEIIVYDKYGQQRGVGASLRFALFLRRRRFDIALILHPTNRMHLITFIAGIRKRVGWRKKLGFLLTHSLPHTKQEGAKHERDYNLELLRLAGIEPQKVLPRLYPDREAEEWIEDFWRRHALGGKTVIALGIGASCPSKIWPTDYFAELAKLLRERYKAEIAVVASEAEKHLRDEFAENYKYEFLDLTGKLDLIRIVSLFRKINLFIGNDSGLTHICAAVDTAVISIFGRGQPGLSPRRWRPLGRKSMFIHKNAGCKICLAHNCQRGFLCLRMIKPEEVALLAAKLLREN